MHTRSVPPAASRRLTGTFRRATPLPSRTFGLALSSLSRRLSSPKPLSLFLPSPCRRLRYRHVSRARSGDLPSRVHTSACVTGNFYSITRSQRGIRRRFAQRRTCCCLVVLLANLFINGEYDASHRLESGPPRRQHARFLFPPTSSWRFASHCTSSLRSSR